MGPLRIWPCNPTNCSYPRLFQEGSLGQCDIGAVLDIVMARFPDYLEDKTISLIFEALFKPFKTIAAGNQFHMVFPSFDDNPGLRNFIFRWMKSKMPGNVARDTQFRQNVHG